MTTTVNEAHVAALPGLTPEAFEVLRAAVNIARHQQVGKLVFLKQKLLLMFPKTEQSVIDSALQFWAQRIKQTEAYAD